MQNLLLQIEELFRWAHKGGILNWGIIGMYLITLFIICERSIYFFRTSAIRTKKQKKKIRSLLAPFEEKLFPLYEKNLSSQSVHLLYHYAQHYRLPEKQKKDLIEREGLLIRFSMEKNLSVLRWVSSLSPMVGLLGTVTGLMRSFASIENLGSTVDISYLAGGIWEAMITTASGLFTAIVAAFASKGFEHVLEKRIQNMTYLLFLVQRDDIAEKGVQQEEKNEPLEAVSYVLF